MDLLIDWTLKEILFKDETVTFEVYPLNNEGVLKILPYVSYFKNLEEEGLDMTKIYEIVKEAKHLFPEHVRNIKGVTINGKEVKIDDLAVEGQLINLALGIMTILINISIPQKTEVKN